MARARSIGRETHRPGARHSLLRAALSAVLLGTPGCLDSGGDSVDLAEPAAVGSIDQPLALAVGPGRIGTSPTLVQDELLLVSGRVVSARAIDVHSAGIDPMTPNPQPIEPVAQFAGHLGELKTDGRWVLWRERAPYSRYTTTILDASRLGEPTAGPTTWDVGPYHWRHIGPRIANGWLARGRFGDGSVPGSEQALELLLTQLDDQRGADPIRIALDDAQGVLAFALTTKHFLWSSQGNDRIFFLEAPFRSATRVELGPEAFPAGGTFRWGPWLSESHAAWATLDLPNVRLELVVYDFGRPVVEGENPQSLGSEVVGLATDTTAPLLEEDRITWIDDQFQIMTRHLRDPAATSRRLTEGDECRWALRRVGHHLAWVAHTPDDRFEYDTRADACGARGEGVDWSIELVDTRRLDEAVVVPISIPTVTGFYGPESIVVGELGIAWVDRMQEDPTVTNSPYSRHRTRFFNPDAPLVPGVNPVDLTDDDDPRRFTPLAFTSAGLVVGGPASAPDADVEESGLWLYDTAVLLRATDR